MARDDLSARAPAAIRRPPYYQLMLKRIFALSTAALLIVGCGVEYDRSVPDVVGLPAYVGAQQARDRGYQVVVDPQQAEADVEVLRWTICTISPRPGTTDRAQTVYIVARRDCKSTAEPHRTGAPSASSDPNLRFSPSGSRCVQSGSQEDLLSSGSDMRIFFALRNATSRAVRGSFAITAHLDSGRAVTFKQIPARVPADDAWHTIGRTVHLPAGAMLSRCDLHGFRALPGLAGKRFDLRVDQRIG